MPDASPTKWHRAHTTWFFEQFLLVPHVKGYTPFHPDFAFLFNSYYVSAGPRYARAHRGVVTRPSVDEVTAYRAHVDAAMEAALLSGDDALVATLASGRIFGRIEAWARKGQPGHGTASA